MESLAEEILREILQKLPARDLIRSSCLCRLWRAVVGDPSFRRIHAKATHVASGSGVETLLVRQIRGAHISQEMIIHNVSSAAKPMCSITDVGSAYNPTNVCNGFICLASCMPNWPIYVCNPLTGDKLTVPPPPKIEGAASRKYAIGFNASTHQYKLFRLSIMWSNSKGGHYLDVYTLGGDGGWRRHPYRFPYSPTHGLHSPPPVFLDGKLYALTARPHTLRVFDTILVIDVASEVHCTYMLGMHAFEMRGKLCVAVDVIWPQRLCFWVMLPLQSMGLPCSWELRYTIYMGDDHNGSDRLRCVWFDDGDRTLCYRMGNSLYKYDTTKDEQEAIGCFSKWDHRIQLPAAPRSENQQWNVYGGYRPSLVSPRLLFAPTSSSLMQHQDEQERFAQVLVHALRRQKSSKESSPIIVD
ncbi:hypothetical protein VPH35_132875 [Triticum aestivum]